MKKRILTALMLYLPPFGRQGTRPMGSDRSRESCPGHHQCRQEYRPHVLDGWQHAQQFSGDGQDLQAGQGVL